jgi:hypothetical protein
LSQLLPSSLPGRRHQQALSPTRETTKPSMLRWSRQAILLSLLEHSVLARLLERSNPRSFLRFRHPGRMYLTELQAKHNNQPQLKWPRSQRICAHAALVSKRTTYSLTVHGKWMFTASWLGALFAIQPNTMSINVRGNPSRVIYSITWS